MINSGTYSLTFKAPNYYTKTVTNVSAANDAVTYLNVILRPIATSSGNEIQAVRDFSLRQNYPNPFNPETNINFSVKEKSDVTIIIYDINGKEVTKLAKGVYQPGNYSIKWNASDFTSGVYFYKMTAGNFTEVRKMVFLK